MNEEPNATVVRDAVVAGPHWRVSLRPLAFKSDLIPLADCWKLMESANVQLRGWDYPHVDRLRAQGQDWVQSWVDFMGHRSFWRFFQSGQFVHVFAFHEDSYGDDVVGRTRARISVPAGFSESGYVDFINLLYTTTEIAEFAARLVQHEAFSSGVQLEIGMEHVANRLLVSVEPLRLWHHFYAATGETLTFAWQGDSATFTGESAALGQRAAVHFYERFGWFDAPTELLVEEQQAFLVRRSGSRR